MGTHRYRPVGVRRVRGVRFPPLDTHDGQRAWAFLAIWGGTVTFTLFAALGVWLVSDRPGFSFWLALAAHGQVLVGMTALGWAMGRRVNIEASRDGIEISDQAAAQRDGPPDVEREDRS